MAEQFNGKWKLTSCKNNIEYYKSLNMPADEIEKNKALDEPANNVETVIKVAGDDYEMVSYVGGKEIFTDKYKIGQKRSVPYDGKTYEVTTTIEGNKQIDVIKREGLKDSKVESVVTGDKIVSTSINIPDGVQAVREYVKV